MIGILNATISKSNEDIHKNSEAILDNLKDIIDNSEDLTHLKIQHAQMFDTVEDHSVQVN